MSYILLLPIRSAFCRNCELQPWQEWNVCSNFDCSSQTRERSICCASNPDFDECLQSCDLTHSDISESELYFAEKKILSMRFSFSFINTILICFNVFHSVFVYLFCNPVLKNSFFKCFETNPFAFYFSDSIALFSDVFSETNAICFVASCANQGGCMPH